MAFFTSRGGRNPRYGQDAGPAPPGGGGGGGGFAQFFPHHHGNFLGQQAPFFNHLFTGMGPFTPLYPPGVPRPTTWPSGGTVPALPPVQDTSLPAASMINSTGGVGCESGYNYFFPSEHTKIHVFKTGDEPPWLLPPRFVLPFHAVHVPVNTTLGELLKGFGARNPDGSKNRIFEVHQGGSGKWYRGMCFKGDDVDAMGKAIQDVGWDKTRTGLPGGKPVVYLYVTKG